MNKAFKSVIILVSLSLTGAGAVASVDHSTYENSNECLGCHPRALPMHRNQKPSKMTENYPLGPTGKMICITCHNCMNVFCILRMESPMLCMNCHDCTQGMACIIGTAHMGDATDDIVHECLGCHDGTIGKIAGKHGDHKIDVLYIPSKSFNRLKDKRIVLINQKITCVSCHDPYSIREDKLVKSNSDSALCLTCHIR